LNHQIRKALIRKSQLAHLVRKFTAKHPGSILTTSYNNIFVLLIKYDIIRVPETYDFELFDAEYIEEGVFSRNRFTTLKLFH
jgi:hypothetical protein